MERNEKAFNFWRTTLKGAKYIVAPMVDQSELPWRLLCRRYGAELCYSPMYHASNFVREPHYRKEALATCAEDRPLIIQFCANDCDILLQAAKLAEPHCDAIDLNLGCPQGIAKRGHYGAFLQDEWDLIASLVRTCADNLSIPITCKIRVFDSIEKTVQYAECIQNAGCQLLTVHGRTREMKGLDTGLASWDHIKAVREKLNIPVFANGNIQYFGDIDRCLKYTGVQGVMVAESNLHNAAIFQPHTLPCWKLTDEYLDLAEKYPCNLSFVRGHVFKLNIHALRVHTDMRDLVFQAKSVECLKLANVKLKDKCLNDTTRPLTENQLPYFMCQPYVRPKPGDETQQKLVKREKLETEEKRERLKRPLEEIFSGIDTSGMSLKKMKRMLRNPHKSHAERKQDRITTCLLCTNIKGSRCAFNLCRSCCRTKTFTEVLDCIGHNFIVKLKTEGYSEYKAIEQKLSEQNDKSDATQSHLSTNSDNHDALQSTDFPTNSDNTSGLDDIGTINSSSVSINTTISESNCNDQVAQSNVPFPPPSNNSSNFDNSAVNGSDLSTTSTTTNSILERDCSHTSAKSTSPTVSGMDNSNIIPPLSTVSHSVCETNSRSICESKSHSTVCKTTSNTTATKCGSLSTNSELECENTTEQSSLSLNRCNLSETEFKDITNS